MDSGSVSYENDIDTEENFSTTENEENYNDTENKENYNTTENKEIYNATENKENCNATENEEKYNATENEENYATKENFSATKENNSDMEGPNIQENKNEETIYIECENYLKKLGYPAGASKLEKAVIRKRAENFK